MIPDEIDRGPYELRGLQMNQTTETQRTDGSASSLSLYVFADKERVPRDADCFDPLSDIAWLQFIDGLDMFVVDGETVLADTVVAEHEAANCDILLVDDAGTVRRRWDLPSKTKEVHSIRRTVERTIEARERGDHR
jgi:hypothetical protein